MMINNLKLPDSFLELISINNLSESLKKDWKSYFPEDQERILFYDLDSIENETNYFIEGFKDYFERGNPNLDINWWGKRV